jgi:phosphatidate phosphatase LPIN
LANGKSSGRRIRRCAPSEQLQPSGSACRYPFQVKLTVNGKHIPFNMKIGEAGEAFFIFETAGDVPDELITSPLLEATRSPGLQGQDAQIRQPGIDEGEDQDAESLGQLPQSEPDFLDLNAPSPPLTSTQPDPQVELEDQEDAVDPSSLFDRATALGASVGNALLEKERDEYLKAKERAKAAYRITQNIAHHGTTEPDDTPPSQQPESMPPEPIYNTGVQISHCVSLPTSDAIQRRGP